MEDFESIAENYIDVIYRVALSYCKDKYDAEDVVQNTFIKLLKSDVEFKDELHLRKWLIRVAVNECKNIWRSFWKRNVSSIEELDTEPEFSEQRESDVYAEIMKLSHKYRVVVHLYYYEGYSIKEISEILNLKETNIQTRLMRARNILKKQLEEWR